MDKKELINQINEKAEHELIEEGLMRKASDGKLVWTDKGMVEAWKTYLKFHVATIDGFSEVRKRQDMK